MKKQKTITHQVDAVVRWVWSLYCFFFDHKWVIQGGRQCPKVEYDCSQNVYRCAHCGDWDYGEEGGPTWHECTFHCSI